MTFINLTSTSHGPIKCHHGRYMLVISDCPKMTNASLKVSKTTRRLCGQWAERSPPTDVLAESMPAVPRRLRKC